MAKRRNWIPTAFHHAEPASDSKRALLLACLGELFYKEFCSRELRETEPSIAARPEKLPHNLERTVADET